MPEIEAGGLDLIALDANGNPLYPPHGARQSKAQPHTIRIAGELGVEISALAYGLTQGLRHAELRGASWVQ